MKSLNMNMLNDEILTPNGKLEFYNNSYNSFDSPKFKGHLKILGQSSSILPEIVTKTPMFSQADKFSF